ncbi:MAG: hypothetical protein HQL56_00970 [Magnetococcales bacterium]|nr:hypothetical protein [Magnetococcales bacterium]
MFDNSASARGDTDMIAISSKIIPTFMFAIIFTIPVSSYSDIYYCNENGKTIARNRPCRASESTTETQKTIAPNIGNAQVLLPDMGPSNLLEETNKRIAKEREDIDKKRKLEIYTGLEKEYHIGSNCMISDDFAKWERCTADSKVRAMRICSNTTSEKEKADCYSAIGSPYILRSKWNLD